MILYKHTNTDKWPVALFDIDGSRHELLPGQSCTLQKRITMSYINVEEITEEKKTKKTKSEDD